jgi:hypothetical protein
MISYSVRAYNANNAEFGFKGLSTDTKPTGSYDGKTIANGSTFFEMDTQEVYFYDGDSSDWLAQP